MLTLKQLEAFFAKGVPWAKSYPVIANEAKKILANWEGPPIRTKALVYLIAPELKGERGLEPTLYLHVYRALNVLRKSELAAFARPAKFDLYTAYKKRGNYWHWFGPKTLSEVPPIPPDTTAIDAYWKDEAL